MTRPRHRMRLASLALLLPLLLASAAPAQDADTFFFQGFEAYKVGRLEEAAERFRAGLAIKDDPNALRYLESIEAYLRGNPPAAPQAPTPAAAPPAAAGDGPVPVPAAAPGEARPDRPAQQAAAGSAARIVDPAVMEASGRWAPASGSCEGDYSEVDTDGQLLFVRLFDDDQLTRMLRYTILSYEGGRMDLRFEEIDPPMDAFARSKGMQVQVSVAEGRMIWHQPEGGEEAHTRCPGR